MSQRLQRMIARAQSRKIFIEAEINENAIQSDDGDDDNNPDNPVMHFKKKQPICKVGATPLLIERIKSELLASSSGNPFGQDWKKNPDAIDQNDIKVDLNDGKSWTMRHFSDNIILPQTKIRNCSFVDYMKHYYSEEKHPILNLTYSRCFKEEATVYICYAWDNELSDLFSAIDSYPKSENTSYWIDIFNINLWSTEQLPDSYFNESLKPLINNINCTFVILNPWENPIVFNRVWCVYELVATLMTDSNLVFLLSTTQLMKMKKYIRKEEKSRLKKLNYIEKHDFLKDVDITKFESDIATNPIAIRRVLDNDDVDLQDLWNNHLKVKLLNLYEDVKNNTLNNENLDDGEEDLEDSVELDPDQEAEKKLVIMYCNAMFKCVVVCIVMLMLCCAVLKKYSSIL